MIMSVPVPNHRGSSACVPSSASSAGGSELSVELAIEEFPPWTPSLPLVSNLRTLNLTRTYSPLLLAVRIRGLFCRSSF